jgi:hypothetical protein
VPYHCSERSCQTGERTDDVKDSFYEEMERVFDKIAKCNINIMLGDLNAQVGREDIFKPTIANKRLHEISNDNGIRIVSFTTSKTSVKNAMFPHHSIHKCTWTSLDRKTHKQIDHILIDRRWHSSALDVRSLRTADCDTAHYPVVTSSE